MSAALAGLGHHVTLCAPWHAGRARGAAGLAALRRDYALDGAFRLRYLPYVTVRQRFGGSYFAVAAVAAAGTRAQLVYTRNPRIAALCTRLGLPVILETHMLLGASTRALEAARAVARSGKLRRWVFISEKLRERFGESVALPAERCVVEHDAVDLERFTPALPAADARARLGLADRPLVVYSGNLYPGRGAELVVENAAALPHVDFLFVGGAAGDIARLRAAAGANVRFTGHLPLEQVTPYLFAADVLVMPHTSRTLVSDRKTSTAEYASPMKLFEYMAAGRAIVATRFPSVAEVLRDGENGVLVAPDDAGALREAIAALVADPARAARLGARAREDAAAHTWARRAERILHGMT
jgi:glycosyltransferase involved in cell wall biosynthesis